MGKQALVKTFLVIGLVNTYFVDEVMSCKLQMTYIPFNNPNGQSDCTGIQVNLHSWEAKTLK